MATVGLNPDGTVRLLSVILAGTPSLPDAVCRARPGLFDDRHERETREQRRERLDAAAAVCWRCPELAVCAQLPPPRGGGVGVQARRVLC